ncbi:MAG: hypothetical protein COZ34_01250 [Candidatus Pacebacteria bacterium CG_4_10_14_3_um_filter_34_15]|nr:DUF4012 domain-containing protein [Candidatus Pacearchaeota archaeon]NCQ65290.1 DUF4012 domain-containing protein [Candidatus Paceibacterota bacterium]OIO44988.1 MAG: hypothetical protein AUJ41_00960 [Candidatus Pacebacteria bacterium CG1_02_43_31]PIQ81069.1 MAG: hypothetical protein COV78_02605 [Candidatus Pacebacteria bacterium CG11_big_fil_rev_8_21_14_0_20_34_55]PIX81886.1 MAG: hypothetical protein COZ34_01250 [Candidatus Pacebacteria bacterium CG_4_10_14_3_um_filter_34_15]PJC44101.1 MAG
MWKRILILLGIISATVFAILIFLVTRTFNQLNNGNFPEARETALKCLYIIEPLSKITFSNNTDLELFKNSLYLISDIPSYTDTLISASNLNHKNNYIFDISGLKITLIDLEQKIQIIDNQINQSKIANKIISEEKLQKFHQFSESLPDMIKFLDSFSNQDQKIIIVFQNSDEIRATGGFMGSYAVLDIVNGKVTEIVTEDIYDADGQFEGFIEAPSGVKEYLSDSKGLRLPNANWNPDFPTSAEQILQFFALGNKKNVTTLIAVNPDYAKLILSITGRITLKDYNTIVDRNNITEVLRSRRGTFFPGSTEKKHILSQLLTQLQIKISNLDEKSKINILQETINQFAYNNIQLYSNVDEIDKIFSKYSFRQELGFKKNADYLFLVESNVGINKANKNITREVFIDKKNNETLITVNFKNNNLSPMISNLSELMGDEIENVNESNNSNKANHLGYVNYQRIFLKQEQNLEYIKYNDSLIVDWHETTIKNSKNEEFKEIGFIITLMEQENSVLEIYLTNNQQNENQIYIQKQPGLPATPYTIKKDSFITQFLLEQNSLINLQ